MGLGRLIITKNKEQGFSEISLGQDSGQYFSSCACSVAQSYPTLGGFKDWSLSVKEYKTESAKGKGS